MNKPTLGIDFDGVIHQQTKGFHDGTIYDPPVPGAKEALDQLAKAFNLVIFTTRLNPGFTEPGPAEQKRRIIEWLNHYEIPFNEVTNNKPRARAYIDDHGFRFTDWDTALNFIGDLNAS